jgi:CspA family cold shock protein
MDQASVSGKVKFFDRAKGYGFVELETGGDAFLHASAFEAAGLAFPSEGDVVRGRVESGPRGAQMIDVERPTRGMGAPGLARGSEGTPALGTVKFFDASKGFGFVAVDDGGPDAILHRNVLDRHRLPALGEGQRVLVLISERPKGREVIAVAALEAPSEQPRREPRLHPVRRPFFRSEEPPEKTPARGASRRPRRT